MSLLCWGTDEINRVARYYLYSYGLSNELISIVDRKYVSACPKIGSEKLIAFEDYIPNDRDIFFPSVSYKNCNLLREDIFNKMLAKFKGDLKRIMSYRHVQSFIARDVTLSPGVWIQEMCSIQTGVKLGNGVVCWANSHIGHSSIIEDFSWITTNATICGEVTIGKGSFIGAGAIITPGVKIAEHNLIGAGAIITKDTQPFEFYYEGRNNLSSRKISTDVI